jgi:hypothetical protein
MLGYITGGAAIAASYGGFSAVFNAGLISGLAAGGYSGGGMAALRGGNILAGTYHGCMGRWRGGRYSLYNPKILGDRGIVIHQGSFHYNTKGCLLSGNNLALDRILDNPLMLNRLNRLFDDVPGMKLNIFSVY